MQRDLSFIPRRDLEGLMGLMRTTDEMGGNAALLIFFNPFFLELQHLPRAEVEEGIK